MRHDMREGKLRTFAVSVMSAVAVAAGLLLIKGQRHEDVEQSLDNVVPAGETVPGTISLERLRELGI
jgi:hypothetical protein